MNVETIYMPRDQAKEELRLLRKAMHKHAHARTNAEYQRLERLYSQAALGRRLINLRQAIMQAPTFDYGLPKLAVARADRTAVNAFRTRDSLEYRAKRDWGERAASLAVTFNNVGFRASSISGWALVPMIPHVAREQAGWRRPLASMFVLWEVEAYTQVVTDAQPDRDPYLIKHIDGDLYAILAQWDLTDIERAVTAARALA